MPAYHLPSINKISEALGGDVTNGQVLAPGPGHSAKDRSLSVKLDSNAPNGFVVHSFAGDDPIACRDYVRSKIGLSGFKPRKKANGGAKPFSPTIAKHVYRLADGAPYLQVHRLADKSGFPQYHWDSEKWINGKPKGPKVPYMLPQLLAAAPATPIYIVEGEKDVDNLAKIGFVATCNSEGADNGNGNKWTSDLNKHFKDRHVYIIPDNDAQGRKHAEHVARNLDPVAKSVRIVELPGLPLKGDVSNWLESDSAGVKLARLAAAAPLWEPTPAPEPPKEEAEATNVDMEITRLAGLSALEYEQQRKAAADKLGFRASMLDKLVAAERAKLNPDGHDGKQGHAISFPEPEPWPDPVDGAKLLDEIAAAIRRHVVMFDHFRDLCSLWVVHCFLIYLFLVSPRLGIRSPTKQCGKTTLLDVLSRLVPRPLPTANVTSAAIFRVIEAYRPTLLIDEADTFLYNNDDLRGILNGNRKGSTVLRTVGDDHEPRAFAIFAACAIALIGSLPDTLHDRAITIDLLRRRPNETIEPFRPDRADYLDALARKAARWAQDRADRIAERDPKMPPGVINRAADNLRPLLAIADEAGGEWPERARKAAEMSRSAEGDEASRLELLLGDVRDIRDEKNVEQIPSSDLVQALVDLVGRPWAEMGKSRKPLTQAKLARMLTGPGFKIAPKQILVLHKGGVTGQEIQKQVRGYVFADFEDAFDRYVPPKGGSKCQSVTNAANTATSEVSKVSQPEDLVTLSKCEKSNHDGLCDTVTLSQGGGGENAHTQPSNGGDPGLPRRDLVRLANSYKERGDAQRNGGIEVDQEELDAGLRQVLTEMVLPEFVEVEFQKVIRLVFAA
jgi:putative DNA primase/helicase